MPSALETLVKILKLEQDTGCQDKAVIGGLRSFGARWSVDAHAQAKKPEHHTLIEELGVLMDRYADQSDVTERHTAIKYMLGRITGRIPSSQSAPPPASVPDTQESSSTSNSTGSLSGSTASNPTATADSSTSAPTSETLPRPEPETRLPRREKNRQKPPLPQPPKAPKAPTDNPTRELLLPDPVTSPSAPTTPPSAPAEAEPTPSIPRFTDRPKLPASEAPRSVPRRRRQSRDQATAMARNLRAPITDLHGIGPKIGEKLQQLGLRTVQDWLYFFPRRYDDFTRMLPLNKLKPGMVVTVVGTIRNAVVIKGRNGLDILQVTIDDGTATLSASFFGQPYLKTKMERGLHLVLSGKTNAYQSRITLDNPEWEFLDNEALHTRGIVPVYPLTKGLSAHAMRRLSYKVIDLYAGDVPDFMPDPVLDRANLPELGWALRQIHFPESHDTLKLAQQRLAFDELMLLQLGVLRNRREWQAQPGIALTIEDQWLGQLVDALPYALTGAQARAVEAIRADMAQPVPMNRLLQGDVGAGKTVVAFLAMSIAIASGYQAAIMAPTGILAEQHLRGLSRLISLLPSDNRPTIRLLTSATPARERAEILQGLAEGTIDMIVGTHSLIQDEVNFARLGMAVIDEQHRFGVEQRGMLRGKGTNPHILIMTATPIPRTLALTMYADLDLTVLDEMPPGRTPIKTMVLEPKTRERAYQFIKAHLDLGRQAFIVYPLVEASESESMSEVRSAVEEYERLQNEIFPTQKLGLLHGRLTPTQKDAVMGSFSRGELEILVSTSVVEVGIDVPNANVILIEGANRFGLAQLHQFRGRVGRGEHPSFCLLVPDDGNVENPRLQAMQETADGFKLAELDWQQRGAGDLLGTRQSGGHAELFGAMDIKLVETAQLEAKTVFEEDPLLDHLEHHALRAQIDMRFAPQDSADMS